MSEERYQYNEFGEWLYPDFIKEAQAAYQVSGDMLLKRLLMKKQGEYTIEDYYALPDECRVELIDGFIYNMSAPSARHQALIGELFFRFRQHILKNKGKCFPFMSPINVQLDEDDRTMVQPDVIVTCNRDKIRNREYYGAPDLVIEVLSPSNRPKEQRRKYQKYKNAGVREYWVVDPAKKRVTVYDFEADESGDGIGCTFSDEVCRPEGHESGCGLEYTQGYTLTHALRAGGLRPIWYTQGHTLTQALRAGGLRPIRYSFQDKVPVHIFGGELIIDFAELFEEIRFLF